MKKLLKVLMASILAIATLFCFTACKDDEGGDAGVIDTTTNTITVGYTDYEPMNYTEDNVLKGFDTELAIQVFNALGYDVRFKLIDWSNKYQELNSNTIQCVWNGFTANCADDDGVQRSEKVDFTYNYMTNAQCVIRKSTTEELTSASQFDGKSVAFESSSAGDSYVSAITGANINKKGCTSQMDAIREVNSGTAQYAVVDLLLAKSIAGKGDYTNIAVNESIVIDAEYYAIAFKKGSTLTEKVNVMLVAFAKTGYLAELAQKYGLSNQVITDFTDQM